MVVVLDSGPVSLATNPNRDNPDANRCNEWLERLIAGGVEVVLPEIVDYELRREMVRANKLEGLRRLDAFGEAVTYLPLSSAAMRRAADLWAAARNAGRPTADDKAIDVDVILAAQALIKDGEGLVIATTNVGHLSRYAPAKLWHDIYLA